MIGLQNRRNPDEEDIPQKKVMFNRPIRYQDYSIDQLLDERNYFKSQNLNHDEIDNILYEKTKYLKASIH